MIIAFFREVCKRRALVVELVSKDLKVRYFSSYLGFLWAFLLPFLMTVIFYLVFSKILKVRTEEAPFFLYLMSAVFPWQFFQNSLISSTASLIDNKNLLREANFAHYLIPVSVVLSNAIVFLPSLFVSVAITLLIIKGLPAYILFLPLIFLGHLIITMGLSIMVSVLYVKWRDIKYLLEASLLLLLYLTPAFYSLSLVKNSFDDRLFKLYVYNPFVGICNLYRLAMFKGFANILQRYANLFYTAFVTISFAFVSLVFALYLYNKNKRTINDYLSY